MKKAVNRFIGLASEGKMMFGGPIHEEAIVRIFTVKETTEK